MVSKHIIYPNQPINWDWATKLRLGSKSEYNKILRLNWPPYLMNRKKDQKQGIWLIWKVLIVGYMKIAKKNWTFKSIWMRGGGLPTREQHVLIICKCLLSLIKLLGLRQKKKKKNRLEENQKAINPQSLDLNNKTKDYKHKRNTSTKIEKLKNIKIKFQAECGTIRDLAICSTCNM